MKHPDSDFLDILYAVCDALCEGETREFKRDSGTMRFRREKDDVFLIDGPFVAVSLGVPSVRLSTSGITDQEGAPIQADQDAIAGLSGRLINLDYERVKERVFPG